MVEYFSIGDNLMGKKIKTFLILSLIFSLFCSISDSINIVNAETNQSEEIKNNQEKIDVYYQSGNQKINLIFHSIILRDQLSSEDKKLFTINLSNFNKDLAQINNFINSPNGLITRIKIKSNKKEIKIKKIIPLLDETNLEQTKFTTGFNYQVLVYLNNWKKVSFSLPISINRQSIKLDDAPFLNYQPTFLINPTIKASKNGYSLVRGISADSINSSQEIMPVSLNDWRITSNDSFIKDKCFLDIEKPGIYQIDYEIVNSKSKKVISFSRKITVLSDDQSEDKDNFTPLQQTELIPINRLGYVNYVPNYGVRVFDDYGDEATATGDYIDTGSQWMILYTAFDTHGREWYCIGTNQWVQAAYIVFEPNKLLQSLNFNARVKEKNGTRLYLGYGKLAVYSGRILAQNSDWKIFGEVKSDGVFWYNLGGNQWVEATKCQKIPK